MNCQSSSDLLFWVGAEEGGKNDLLFLAESTNVPNFKPDDIRKFLTPDEIIETRVLESQVYFAGDSMLPIPPVYKDFGEIYGADQYSLRVIFRDGNDRESRDYQFILRSYDRQFRIIDSFRLATWVKRDEDYCFGEIDRKLVIEKRCQGGRVFSKHRITKEGRFQEVVD